MIFWKHILVLLPLMPIYAFTQESPIGKTYQRILSETCKMTTDGGCTLKTFENIRFERDTVFIFETIVASCTDPQLEKNHTRNRNEFVSAYSWRQSSPKIIIQHWKENLNFELANEQLIDSKGTVYEAVKAAN